MATILKCEGKTDDLLTVSPDGTMKCANVVYLGENPMNEESEVFHISVSSCSMNGEHEVFDEMLGKTIQITVDILEE